MHLTTFDIDGILVDSNDFDTNLYANAIQKILDLKVDADWSQFKNVTDRGILDQIIAENKMHAPGIDIHARVRRCFVRQTEDYISKSEYCQKFQGQKS